MSLPVTDEEKRQCDATLDQRTGTENVVSTACPGCGTRFALLAKHHGGSEWHLRCVLCGYVTKGEPK